jgi:hypothetical protein
MGVPFLARRAAAAPYHLPPRVPPSIQAVEGGQLGLLHKTPTPRPAKTPARRSTTRDAGKCALLVMPRRCQLVAYKEYSCMFAGLPSMDLIILSPLTLDGYGAERGPVSESQLAATLKAGHRKFR